MGGGTNGAGHVNMGLPYKAYKAEQVSAMQVMVVGVHTEMAGYEQVGMLMQGTAGAIEAAGMGPVMHLAIGGGNIRLPSVARPTNALVMPPAYDNSFTEVMIGPEGADTMVELRGEWKDRIKIEAAMAEAVAIPQNWELATGEEVVVHVELNAARFGSELRDVAAIGFAAEEAKVKSMIEALGGEAAYVGMRHWGAVGQCGQVRERQDAR
tara:strand:+ start:196 stop:825 length:630 start_codon:yes stop_codon:yes gene_type:complete